MDEQLYRRIREIDGTAAIREWREQNPPPPADAEFVKIPEIDLAQADLRSFDFSHADLSGAKLMFARLEVANFEGADLQGANFNNSNVSWGRFTRANLTHAAFSHVNATSAFFNEAILDYVDAASSTFAGAHFINARGKALDMHWSNCSRGHFMGTKFELVDFRCCDLTGARFINATLTEVRFGHAKITKDAFHGTAVIRCYTTLAELKDFCPSGFIHSRARGRLVPRSLHPDTIRKQRQRGVY